MAWDTVSIWLFFLIGQALHIWLRASLVVRSQLNGVETYGHLFSVKGPAIAARFFLETCLFMLYEHGAFAWFPQALPQGGSVLLKVPAAGLIGYGADSFLDQALAKIGLDKELPPKDGDGPKIGTNP